MRLAYLILAHHQPQQLERLVKRLVSNRSDVFIHLDKKSNINDFLVLADLPNTYFIKNRVAVVWGNYSMVQATLNGFEEILKHSDQYSHINLLSGQDYPLKSSREIEDYLFANADKSYMRYRSIMDEWQESASRITLYSLGDYDFPLKYKLQGLMNKWLPQRKPPYGLKPYGFSQWISITPAAVSYVLKYLKDHPAAKRFFRMTWGVDELFFQTILLNSSLKETIVNNHLRYIKFVPGASRPNTLTSKDAEALTSSGKLFARKFDPDVDTAILDYLDQEAGKI